MSSSEDMEFMRLAIKEARQSVDEDARPHPKVGAVIAKGGELLASAHRGEMGAGGHAEYTVMEEKLPRETLASSTVYTTLEPCTTRNHPKVPCAHRIVERKVGRVVVGMLDPNPIISGKGILSLRDAGVDVELFPAALMAQVEELNREFIRSHKNPGVAVAVDEKFVRIASARSIDEWFQVLNSIYWNRNFDRQPTALFAHLVEVTGGLSLLASQKKKPEVRPETFVPKALAWWLALCGKIGIRSVEDMVWTKFPRVCPYCLQAKHDQFRCAKAKASRPGPDWEALRSIGSSAGAARPKSLGQWQRMFLEIYEVSQTEDYGPTFARLAEELGELSEAVRIFPAAPGYFVSEASDVFAWLMHVQNIIEYKTGVDKEELGTALERGFSVAYPDRCTDCDKEVCMCPPILEATVGRIAHEIPRVGGNLTFVRYS